MKFFTVLLISAVVTLALAWGLHHHSSGHLSSNHVPRTKIYHLTPEDREIDLSLYHLNQSLHAPQSRDSLAQTVLKCSVWSARPLITPLRQKAALIWIEAQKIINANSLYPEINQILSTPKRDAPEAATTESTTCAPCTCQPPPAVTINTCLMSSCPTIAVTVSASDEPEDTPTIQLTHLFFMAVPFLVVVILLAVIGWSCSRGHSSSPAPVAAGQMIGLVRVPNDVYSDDEEDSSDDEDEIIREAVPQAAPVRVEVREEAVPPRPPQSPGPSYQERIDRGSLRQSLEHLKNILAPLAEANEAPQAPSNAEQPARGEEPQTASGPLPSFNSLRRSLPPVPPHSSTRPLVPRSSSHNSHHYKPAGAQSNVCFQYPGGPHAPHTYFTTPPQESVYNEAMAPSSYDGTSNQFANYFDQPTTTGNQSSMSNYFQPDNTTNYYGPPVSQQVSVIDYASSATGYGDNSAVNQAAMQFSGVVQEQYGPAANQVGNLQVQAENSSNCAHKRFYTDLENNQLFQQRRNATQ